MRPVLSLSKGHLPPTVTIDWERQSRIFRPMKRMAVQTLGCRLNQYESEKMAAELASLGMRRVPWGQPADLYLINTCTVTHKADATSRQVIARAARENPSGRIIVAGCFVDKDPHPVADLPGVDIVVPNKDKGQIREIVRLAFPELLDSGEPDAGCSTSVASFQQHNRAWLKVSDGCNQWCSFCIIPQVRGRLSNRSPREIIDEINGLVAAGFNEVVLTGVHVGHYKWRKSSPEVKNLAGLIRLILDKTDMPRVRVSSIEPQTVRGDIVDLFAERNPRLCRHWHMPLQSGSSRVLKLMRRPYDQATYIERVLAIKEKRARTVIGADVIVGFPGESDADFERTRKLCSSGLIDYLHVFSYSDRPGTHAATLSDKVEPTVIKARNAELTRISRELRAATHRRMVGETVDVIAEDRSDTDGRQTGVADNFVRVLMPDDRHYGRELVRLRVTEATTHHVVGASIGRPASVLN